MMAEKVDKGVTLACQIGMALIVGWMGSSIWHQTAVTDQAAVVLPKVQALAGCEHWLAGKDAALAKQDTIVDPKSIPKDNCPKLPPIK